MRPSFFLTAPARKPRTLCCCQPVAACSSSIVAPSWRLSRSRQVCCLVCFRLQAWFCCECQRHPSCAFAVSAPSLFCFSSSHLVGAGAWCARPRLQFSSRQQDEIWPLGGPPFGQPRLMRGAPTTQSPAIEARRSRPLAPCLLGHQRRQHGRSLRERSPVLCATFGRRALYLHSRRRLEVTHCSV